MSEEAIDHLGNILYMLAGLDEGDRTAAYENAVAFYNKARPDKKVSMDCGGFVTKLTVRKKKTRAQYMREYREAKKVAELNDVQSSDHCSGDSVTGE